MLGTAIDQARENFESYRKPIEDSRFTAALDAINDGVIGGVSGVQKQLGDFGKSIVQVDPQKFLQDRIRAIATMAAPIPPAAKMVINLEGSAPTREDEYNPGPLIKIGGDGVGIRQAKGKYKPVNLPAKGVHGILGSLLQY